MGQMDQFQRLELEEVHKSSPSKVGSRAQPNENPFDTPIEDMDGGLDALDGSDAAQDTSHAQFLSVHVKFLDLLVNPSLPAGGGLINVRRKELKNLPEIRNNRTLLQMLLCRWITLEKILWQFSIATLLLMREIVWLKKR